MKTEMQSLEELIAKVRSRRASRGEIPLPKSGWKDVAGTVQDNALFREAARLGEAWRKSQNKLH